jgi:hypothetical protein
MILIRRIFVVCVSVERGGREKGGGYNGPEKTLASSAISL